MARLRKATTATPVKNTGSSRRGSVPPSAPSLESVMDHDDSSDLTFNILDVESKKAASGKKGFRVTTLGGATITWWSAYADGTTWRDLIADNGDGTASVKPNVRIAQDGGLIPASAPALKGFWS